MEVQTVVLFLVCLASALLYVAADFQPHSDQAGVHCGNVTIRPTQQQQETDHYHCVQCLFPQNCQANNTCRLGTTGSMCEQCQPHTEQQHRYHRVGSMCTLCPDVPWATVSFGVYFILFLGMWFFLGFTDIVCTKMKLLCHFLQYLQLTIHIKVEWPDDVVQFVSNTCFTSFNTNILNPECLSWPEMSEHYSEWLTSLCIPVVVIFLGYILDKSMAKLGKGKKSDSSVQWGPRRTTLRRLVFLVVIMMYMPAAVSCIRTFQCSATVPTSAELVLDPSESIFLLNNNVLCETFAFQTIHFVASIYLVIMVFLCPLMIAFFTLRQRKWDLLYQEWTLYSPVYEAYKDRFCFWESIPLLRKLVAVLITEAYPYSQEVQVFVQLGMSAAYIVLVVLLRPYRPTYWGHPVLNAHIIFEVISNVVICVVQGVALTILSDEYESLYGIGVITLVGTVLAIWLATVLLMSCETRQAVNLDQVVPFVEDNEAETKPKLSRFKFWFRKTRRVEQDTRFAQNLSAIKERINF